MTPRRLLPLAVILLLLWGVGSILRSREKVPTLIEGTLVLIPTSWNLENLKQIDLQLGSAESSQIQVRKEPTGEWIVPTSFDAPAKMDRLEAFMSAISGLSGEERAHGEKWFNDFGLDQKALRILLKDAEGAAQSIVVGRKDAKQFVTFARLNEDEAIYAIDENLLGYADLFGGPSDWELMPTSWIDMRVVPVDARLAKRVELSEWSRRKKEWIVQGGAEGPFQGTLHNELSRLRNLRGADIADPGRSEEFRPQWRWSLALEDGSSLQIEEAVPGQEKTVIRRLPDGPYFQIAPDALEGQREKLLAALKEAAELQK